MKFAHYIRADNFTKIYKELQEDLMYDGELVKPRNMATRELMNVSLILDNPRDRILYSKIRKHNYTYGAAEFLWYMAGVNDLAFVAFYLSRMKDYSDDGLTLNSGYGYRIFGNHPDFPNQWRNVQYKLLADKDTRQAVISVYYQNDLIKASKDVPCTLNLHFIIRHNELNMFVQMRSNDAYMGLIYDVFSFTLMQEHMFNFLKHDEKLDKLKLGTYVHRSDSMHAYERNILGLKNLLLEEESDIANLRHEKEFLIFNSEELPYLLNDEKILRGHKIPIVINKYQGMCRFMAEKLNRILVK